MKRTPLRRKAWIKRKTRIKEVNPERAARRKAKYEAFIRSPAWRAIREGALERAGRRCEQMVWRVILTPYSRVWDRCPATTRLTCHHKSYQRFGGKELPRDLMILCKDCHRALHAKDPTKKIRRTA